ncbi:MAG: TetR/AcrR family transcriptional regulator [Jatrophihabitans sp.]
MNPTVTRHTDIAPVDAVPQRRRGAALEDAILVAAYAELSEVGYRDFSVEAVSSRARTGKASIYRRWPTKPDLVMDALLAELPSPKTCGLTDDLVLDDTVTTADALLQVGTLIVSILTSPAGSAMRAIKFEALGDPELAELVDARFQAPRRTAMINLLQRGIERGEVRPDAATAATADVLPAMLMHKMIMLQENITESDVHDVITKVMIPLVEAHR